VTARTEKVILVLISNDPHIDFQAYPDRYPRFCSRACVTDFRALKDDGSRRTVSMPGRRRNDRQYRTPSDAHSGKAGSIFTNIGADRFSFDKSYSQATKPKYNSASEPASASGLAGQAVQNRRSPMTISVPTHIVDESAKTSAEETFIFQTVDSRIFYPSYVSFDEFIDVDRLRSLDGYIRERILSRVHEHRDFRFYT
jgi:hypothetical protein